MHLRANVSQKSMEITPNMRNRVHVRTWDKHPETIHTKLVLPGQTLRDPKSFLSKNLPYDSIVEETVSEGLQANPNSPRSTLSAPPIPTYSSLSVEPTTVRVTCRSHPHLPGMFITLSRAGSLLFQP